MFLLHLLIDDIKKFKLKKTLEVGWNLGLSYYKHLFNVTKFKGAIFCHVNIFHWSMNTFW